MTEDEEEVWQQSEDGSATHRMKRRCNEACERDGLQHRGCNEGFATQSEKREVATLRLRRRAALQRAGELHVRLRFTNNVNKNLLRRTDFLSGESLQVRIHSLLRQWNYPEPTG